MQLRRIEWEKIQQPEEKQFLKMLSDHEYRFEMQRRSLFTDFYQIGWMKDVLCRYLGHEQLPGLVFIGGYEEAERTVAGFVDEYGLDEEPIRALRIDVRTGLGKPLSHRDYLGALLGLGIERSKVGDLIIDEDGAYMIVKPPLDDFIQWNLTGIGRYQQLTITPVSCDEIKVSQPQIKAIRGTVASLRADSVFALAFGVSRSTVVKLLQNEKGLRFGSTVTANTLLKEGDVCVLRGYGKFRLGQISGLTKKDRLSIEIEKYV
ncbi:MAG: YlmH/Sll1252 family protein [Cellulosilyticaceae bacterium]